jgi:hypothetical protein
MEDDLKIFKVEYLSNHVLDLTQIWDLSLGFSSHWLDLTQTQNLILDGKMTV